MKNPFIWKSILDFNKQTTPNDTTTEGCIFGPKICGTTTNELVTEIDTNKPELNSSSQNGALRSFQSIQLMIALIVLSKISCETKKLQK